MFRRNVQAVVPREVSAVVLWRRPSFVGQLPQDELKHQSAWKTNNHKKESEAPRWFDARIYTNLKMASIHLDVALDQKNGTADPATK